MAQSIGIDAKGIEKAAELATKLISSHTAEGRRFRFPLLEGELQKEQARDVKRLHELLEMPEVGGPLSLANPYPVEVAGVCNVSYAHCVCEMFRELPREKLPDVDLIVAYQCCKEFERATGKPCNVEMVSKIRSRNIDRDSWIVKQHQAGRSLNQIKDSLQQQNPDWYPLSSAQAVHEVLKRRGQD